MVLQSKKKSFLDCYIINDKNSCDRAIRNGGTSAMISAAITGGFGVAGFFMNSGNQEIKYLLNPWILTDAALLIVLAIFVFRKSRIAATLLVIYFVASKVYIWYELGKPSGEVLSIIFIAYFVMAMRGTFLWHAKYGNIVKNEIFLSDNDSFHDKSTSLEVKSNAL